MGARGNASCSAELVPTSSTAQVSCAILSAFRTTSYSTVSYSSRLTPLGFCGPLTGERNRRKVSRRSTGKEKKQDFKLLKTR